MQKADSPLPLPPFVRYFPAAEADSDSRLDLMDSTWAKKLIPQIRIMRGDLWTHVWREIRGEKVCLPPPPPLLPPDLSPAICEAATNVASSAAAADQLMIAIDALCTGRISKGIIWSNRGRCIHRRFLNNKYDCILHSPLLIPSPLPNTPPC